VATEVEAGRVKAAQQIISPSIREYRDRFRRLRGGAVDSPADPLRYGGPRRLEGTEPAIPFPGSVQARRSHDERAVSLHLDALEGRGLREGPVEPESMVQAARARFHERVVVWHDEPACVQLHERLESVVARINVQHAQPGDDAGDDADVRQGPPVPPGADFIG
jgi:hypothetical protein